MVFRVMRPCPCRPRSCAFSCQVVISQPTVTICYLSPTMLLESRRAVVNLDLQLHLADRNTQAQALVKPDLPWCWLLYQGLTEGSSFATRGDWQKAERTSAEFPATRLKILMLVHESRRKKVWFHCHCCEPRCRFSSGCQAHLP